MRNNGRIVREGVNGDRRMVNWLGLLRGLRRRQESWGGGSALVLGVRNGLSFKGSTGDGAGDEELAKLWWRGIGIMVVLIEGKAGADRLGPEAKGIKVSPDRSDL